MSNYGKKILIASSILMLLSSCSSKKQIYTIVFKNGESVIQTIGVEEGIIPYYYGPTPTKENSTKGNYITRYTFSGWSPSIKPANADATYEARFHEMTTFNFEKFRNNHSPSELKEFLNKYGKRGTSYEQINGVYDDYNCVSYFFYGKSSLEYFPEYNTYRVIFRNGSRDLAISVFKFQAYNYTNGGLIMSLNGINFTSSCSVNKDTLYGTSSYSFVNYGFYELNVFSCEKGSVILTN